MAGGYKKGAKPDGSRDESLSSKMSTQENEAIDKMFGRVQTMPHRIDKYLVLFKKSYRYVFHVLCLSVA